MIANLTRRRWVFLVRGLCGIAIGIVAFTQPLATLLALIVVWGALLLADGLTSLWAGWTDRHDGRGFGPLLTSGAISLVAGVTAWMWPGMTTIVLLFIIAIWSILRGLFEIWAAIRLRRVIHNEWLMATAGALSVLFGVVLVSRPAIGLVALAYLIGSYAMVSGVVLVVLAVKLRRLRGLVA
jgi:uncharacterized membrane protein HdeD (DUF308 family)